MTLRIANWSGLYENAESRKLKTLKWVAIPNKMSGQGYTALIDHPNGAAHFGAWCAILEICSAREPREKRGILPESDGTIGGISRALGRISRLPVALFEEIIPRLLKDPDIKWLEELPGVPGENPEAPGEFPGISGESPDVPGGNPEVPGANRREGKGREGKGTEQPAAPAPAKVAEMPRRREPDTSMRFAEWVNGFRGRVTNEIAAARAWTAYVTAETELAAFACRDRYNASDDVSRGILMEASRFITDQSENQWRGDWPKGRNSPHKNGPPNPTKYFDINEITGGQPI